LAQNQLVRYYLGLFAYAKSARNSSSLDNLSSRHANIVEMLQWLALVRPGLLARHEVSSTEVGEREGSLSMCK